MHLQPVRALGLLTAALVLAACTGSPGSGPPPAGEPPGTVPPASGAPSAGASTSSPAAPSPTPAAEDRVGGSDCALTEDQLGRVVRDWRRVDGSVDRPDHQRWTRALVARVRQVAGSAEGCAGRQRLAAFVDAAERIDRRAGRGAVDYDAYDRATELGDAWLRAVGLGVKKLSRG